MTNDFKRFQLRNQFRAKSKDYFNSSFITKGLNSTIISNGDVKIPAAVVNKQEDETAYIYITNCNELPLGSIWSVKNLFFLISEEIIIVHDVTWKKYLAQLCNVHINDIHGRFIGPEKSYVNTTLKEKGLIISLQKPLIILPSNTLQVGDKIVINNRPWLVQEYDNISTSGVTYYSLTPTTVSADIAELHSGESSYIVTQKKIEHSSYENIFEHNIDITLPTEDGYFKYDNPSIQIIKHQALSVTFQIPFGVDTITISTKQKGEVVTTTYSVQ